MMDVQDNATTGVVEDDAATLNWLETRIQRGGHRERYYGLIGVVATPAKWDTEKVDK